MTSHGWPNKSLHRTLENVVLFVQARYDSCIAGPFVSSWSAGELGRWTATFFSTLL